MLDDEPDPLPRRRPRGVVGPSAFSRRNIRVVTVVDAMTPNLRDMKIQAGFNGWRASDLPTAIAPQERQIRPVFAYKYRNIWGRISLYSQ